VLPNEFLSHPHFGTINLHYSLLPSLRGVYPVNWALVYGHESAGITYHLVSPLIDSGPVLLSASIPVLASDTARSLQLRLDDLADETFDALLLMLANTSPSASQDIQGQTSSIDNYKSRKDFANLCKIDLGKQYSGQEWLNLLRGLTFFDDSPNAYFIDRVTGEKIFVSIKLRPALAKS
jgi:methionyl-tRNA formyltransferase